MLYAFVEFELDTASRQLLKAGRAIHLEPKAFELLGFLLERRPEAVSKADIRDRLWPDSFVSDASLTGLVTQLRQALGDSRADPKYLRTVHGFGYAFCAEASSDAAPPRSGAHRVLWEGRPFPLAPGENVLGRDASALVQVDLPGVSRRHARIVVDGERAILEDLASKNGTLLNERGVTSPVALADGDAIRLGRHLLVYRSTPASAPTRTDG